MKILLIEDRTPRQELFMKDLGIDLLDLKYNDILDNAIEERYEEVYKQLQNDNFNFNNYSIVISHKSAFDENNEKILAKLKKGINVLILFSGGIDTNYYVKNDKLEILELNSKIFYSNNLKKFLDNFRETKPNILSLCYGDKWKLNIALNIVEEINYMLNETNDSKIDCDDLIDNLAKEILDEIDIELFKKVNHDKTDRNELIVTKNKILSYINESLVYE